MLDNNNMVADAIVLPCDGPKCPGKSSTQHKCGRCCSSYYCSLSCQKDHWASHKPFCVDFALETRALLAPQPVYEVATSGINLACGMCSASPMKDMVVLDRAGTTKEGGEKWCQHAYCATCLQDYDATQKKVLPASPNIKDDKTKTSSDDSKQQGTVVLPPCRLCEATQGSGTRTKTVTDLILGRAAMYVSNAKHVDLEDKEHRENLALAVRELQKLIGPPPHKNDKEKRSTLSPSHHSLFSKEAILDAMSWKLELMMEMGQTEQGMDEWEVEQGRFKDDTPTPNRVIVCMAKRHEAAGEWEQAQAEYAKIMDGGGAPTKIDTRESLLGMSRTHLKLKKLDEAIQYGKLAIQSGSRRHVGIHKTLAMAQKEQGDLEGARRTMDLAIAYEEPWNHDNRDENTAFRNQLTPEELLKEEQRKEEEAFLKMWGKVLSLEEEKASVEHVSWTSLKTNARYDIQGATLEDTADFEEEKRDEETEQKLDSAAQAALSVEEEVFSDNEDDTPIAERTEDLSTWTYQPSAVSFDDVFFTDDIMKWRRIAEPTYWNFFVDRITELAKGHRSHKKSKRLMGTQNVTIYETYLDSNQRILWTESRETGLLIRYVAMHKEVSTMMKKIDDAHGRSMRRLTPASELPEFATEDAVADHQGILLDPLTDTPMKRYVVHQDDFSRLRANTGWEPKLHLTTQEREVVERQGTVLLLGRSGTGKTICISSRIEHDRELNEHDDRYSQLFIARSGKICEYVKGMSSGHVDTSERTVTHYRTFEQLLHECEAAILAHEGEMPSFNSLQKVGFLRFKRDFGAIVGKCGIDMLIVWTQIRSFIKGSIQAVIRRRPITLEEYLDETLFGKRRCRLTLDQRKACYEAYESYEKIRKEENLWDDTDRIISLLHGLTANEDATQQVIHKNVYVDEVQDYTQAEIALFFHLSTGGMFLAGDPAQSVVEGVEFRFEEVRSVAHELFQLRTSHNSAEERNRFIPSKPMKVTVNFRSHAGVLNVAAAVLDRLFGAFPDCAPDLGKDLGVFMGPRPAVLENMNWQKLKDVASKIDGVVLLTMYDEHVQRLKDLVAENEKKATVLSIRDSKGLEFADIIMVDFFKELAENHQKPWRSLLGGNAMDPAFKEQYPEIETQLKQLYTAITRCSKRFYVAETETSVAGSAFGKYTSKLQLTVQQSAMEVKGNIFTTDQWNAAGVEYAANSENRGDFENAAYFLRQAVNYFQQADNSELLHKANLHLESLEFRQELGTTSPANLSKDHVESRGIDLLEKLIAEGVLMMEARKVYEALKPVLNDYARDNLDHRLVPWLPALDA